MADFPKLFIQFSILGLFVFGIIAFAVGLQSDNSAKNPLLGNSELESSYRSLNKTLISQGDNASSFRNSFEQDDPVIGLGALVFNSIIGGGRIFIGLIFGVFNTLISLLVSVIGIDPLVISVFISIIIALGVFGIWKIVKAGG